MVSGGVVEAFVGDRITMTGSAAITAGQVVAYTGNRTVGPAGALSIVVAGVALQSYDNVPGTGAKLAVAVRGVYYLTASGAIGAGDKVVAAAAGAVQTIGANTAEKIIGIATEAIANGQTGRVLLRI